MKFIIYCRKSTDSEDRQVLSLESQENELRALAKAKGLQVVEVLIESKSAKKAGRPVFNDMLKMIERGKVDGIICWKLDRLARNMRDGGVIIDLLQNGIIKEIHTHEGVHRPSDNVLLMSVNLGMANQYIRDLSENVKRGMTLWNKSKKYFCKQIKPEMTFSLQTIPKSRKSHYDYFGTFQ